MQTFFENQLVEILPSKYVGPQETDHCAGHIIEVRAHAGEALVELKGTGKLWWIPTRNLRPAFKVVD
jgi:hypothetical protein